MKKMHIILSLVFLTPYSIKSRIRSYQDDDSNQYIEVSTPNPYQLLSKSFTPHCFIKLNPNLHMEDERPSFFVTQEELPLMTSIFEIILRRQYQIES